jgi:transposase
MLHAGLDLSRRKLDVCLLSERREHVDQLAVPPDVDSLRTLARRIDGVHGQHVCAVVESMTGARLVHDTLEQEGWSVESRVDPGLAGAAAPSLHTPRTQLTRAKRDWSGR